MRNGALCLCLMLSAACSRENNIVIGPPVDVPEWKGTTNAELVEYALELREALEKCNAR